MTFHEKNKGARLEIKVGHMIGVEVCVGLAYPYPVLYAMLNGDRYFAHTPDRMEMEKMIDILRGKKGSVFLGSNKIHPYGLTVDRDQSDDVSFNVNNFHNDLYPVETQMLAGFLEMLLENGIYRIEKPMLSYTMGNDDCPLTLRQFQNENGVTVIELGVGRARIDLSDQDLAELRKFWDKCLNIRDNINPEMGLVRGKAVIAICNYSRSEFEYSGYHGAWKSGRRRARMSEIKELNRIISE